MINEMELENKKEKVKMPWQGKVLLFIFVFSFLISLFWLFLKIFFNETSYSSIFVIGFKMFASPYSLMFNEFVNLSKNNALIISLFIELLIFLFVYLGKKTSLILLFFSELFTIYIVYRGLFKTCCPEYDLIYWFFIALFSIYLEISCFFHPYFNQKKELKEK